MGIFLAGWREGLRRALCVLGEGGSGFAAHARVMGRGASQVKFFVGPSPHYRNFLDYFTPHQHIFRMSKKNRPNGHRIKFRMPERTIQREPLILQIEVNGKNSGRLRISQGGIAYYPPQVRKPLRFRWDQFLGRLRVKEEG